MKTYKTGAINTIILKSWLVIFLVIIGSIVARAEEADSIKSKELEEVVVTAKRGWVEGDKVVFLPTKQEKRLSNSPASLLSMMNLPMLRIEGNDGPIKSIGGEDVSLYINGNPASNIDIKTFWPKNAKRIEYMENPKDPRFRGARKVINIVAAEYEVGGVTKIDARQTIPGGGDYSAASKLEYKKMTYGLLFNGGYSRDHREVSEREEVYRDLFFEGEKYDQITRKMTDRSYTREDRANLSFSAQYKVNKYVGFTHTAKLSWERNPGSGSSSDDIWNPALFGGNFGSSLSRSRSLSPQISGDYFFGSDKNFAIPIGWSYVYGHTNLSSWYTMGEMPEIYNASIEDVNTLSVNVKPYMILNPKFTFQLMVNGKFNWFSTQYDGSATAHNNQARQDMNSELIMWWTITPKFFILASPGVDICMWKIGEDKNKSVSPKGRLGFSWNPSYKFSVYAQGMTNVSSPSYSETTPVMIKQTDLMWRIGNPALKADMTYANMLQCTWLPLNNFSLGLLAHYTKHKNETVVNYEVAPKEQGGIIGREIDNISSDAFYLSANFSLSLFNSKLKLTAYPDFNHVRYHGLYSSTLTSFSGLATAKCVVGNVMLSVMYFAPKKFLDNGGMEKRRQSDRLSLGVTYGVGNFYFNIEGNDLLHSKADFRTDYISACYSYSDVSKGYGRSLNINITYTFDYGKKVDHNIQVSGAEAVDSSVIK